MLATGGSANPPLFALAHDRGQIPIVKKWQIGGSVFIYTLGGSVSGGRPICVGANSANYNPQQSFIFIPRCTWFLLLLHDQIFVLMFVCLFDILLRIQLLVKEICIDELRISRPHLGCRTGLWDGWVNSNINILMIVSVYFLCSLAGFVLYI